MRRPARIVPDVFDVIVLGAGPAGVLAALRAAELGARTALVTAAEFGGMAANDGPVPVRTLAYAARLMRDTRQLSRYGITTSEPALRYDRLLARVHEVAHDVSTHSALREKIDASGVTVYEQAGVARFTSPRMIETEDGLQLEAVKFILSTGGIGRKLAIPGFEHTHTHSEVFKLTSVPPTMLVIGGGDTGVQLASMFRAFGSEVQLFERGPRILRAADDTVAAAVAAALRESGVAVRERFGAITSFDRMPSGVRMNFRNGDRDESAEAALVVMAAG